MIRTTELRMSNGMAEQRSDGRTIHVDLEDVKTVYGDTVLWILRNSKGVQIVEHDYGPIKRSIIKI